MTFRKESPEKVPLSLAILYSIISTIVMHNKHFWNLETLYSLCKDAVINNFSVSYLGRYLDL